MRVSGGPRGESLEGGDQRGRSEYPFAHVCGKCGATRIDSQIGLEATPEAYVEKLVAVFREVRRVLRDDGTVWLNLGDSYANDTKWGGSTGGKHVSALHGEQIGRGKRQTGLKPKDLIGIPWAVAKALQAPFYAGRIKSERDRIYLAATIDADGTICGFTHKRKDNGDIRRGIHVTVTNSNIRMLDECYRIWATSKQDHNAHGKGHFGKLDTFRWIAHDLLEKQQLLAELYPYFICKQKQALLAWNFLEISKQARGRNKGTEGDENREKSAWVVHALSRLNHLEPVDIPAWIKEPASMFEPGWYLRQDCIWSKPNCMPESVTDRCTKAHEYIFLLTKSARYFYDAEAVKEPAAFGIPNSPESIASPYGQGFTRRAGSWKGSRFDDGKNILNHPNVGKNRKELRSDIESRHRSSIPGGQSMQAEPLNTRNRRSVWKIDEDEYQQFLQWKAEHAADRKDTWTITTKPFKEAHFATFPPEIPEICIKAGSKPGDTVLDPFSGAGTTGNVAERLGRKYIGIELNPAYAEMGENRIEAARLPLFGDVK